MTGKLLALALLGLSAFGQTIVVNPKVAASQNYAHSLCGLGDSIITWQSIDPLVFGPSIMNQIATLSLGKIQVIKNAGISGQTSAQILARLSDVTSQACGKVLVIAGTNDVIGLLSLSVTEANLLSIYRGLLSNNQLPIACTIPPHTGTGYQQISQLNIWIRKTAQTLGIPLIDIFGAVADPTTGDYKSGYSSDGIHPTGPAGRIIAQAALNDLAAVFPGHHALLPYTNADPNNLLANALNLTSSGGIPTGWTASSVSGRVTYTVATDANIVGNAAVATKSTSQAGDNDDLSPGALNTGFSPGDKIAFVGKVVTANTESGGLPFSIALYGYTVGFGAQTFLASPVWGYTGTDIPAGQFYLEVTIPATTVWLAIEVRYANGTGTVKFGQMGIYNLTTMGAAQ